MAPFYKHLADVLPVFCQNFDSKLHKDMTEENTKKLGELQEKIKDAEDNLGETEISDALVAKFHYLATILDKVTSRRSGCGSRWAVPRLTQRVGH